MKAYIDTLLALVGAQLAVKYLPPTYLLYAYMLLMLARIVMSPSID